MKKILKFQTLFMLTIAITLLGFQSNYYQLEKFEKSRIAMTQLNQSKTEFLNKINKGKKVINSKIDKIAIIAKRKSNELEQVYLKKKFEAINRFNPVMKDYINNFVNFDVTIPSQISESDFNELLIDTPLYGYGWIFKNAEEKHGINGLFLLALTGQEQDYGRAETICKYRNNLTSWMAYDHDVNMAMTFESYWHCIDYTSNQLKLNYLNSNGKFHNGTTPRKINIYYATDKNWSNGIAYAMNEKMKELMK